MGSTNNKERSGSYFKEDKVIYQLNNDKIKTNIIISTGNRVKIKDSKTDINQLVPFSKLIHLR